jgi:glutamine amidotransferase
VIAVLDYGMGNLRSVEKAFEHVGAEVEITYEPARIRAASALVLPGVGAFPRAMQAIGERGLDELVHERRAAGVPILGICLGMQLLFKRSVELGGADGLGLLPGEVRELDAPGLKIPQIGWNEVAWQRESPLTAGLSNPAAFYHVHSFAPLPADEADILGRGDYGGPFVSIVARDPLYGCQFHPEKSSADGLRLLANFAAICARQPAR